MRPEFYDKHHLVPFGEYMPFSDLLERVGITQFVAIPGGFDAGSGTNVLHISGLPTALAMICYEAIFPDEVGTRRSRRTRPAQWLLNVTDDAWFGLTSGPYQHFAQARLRAIELGLPLVRAANTGVSAVTDGFGRVLAQTSLGSEAVLDSPLPEPLAPTWQLWFASCVGGVAGELLALALLRGNLSGDAVKLR